MRRIRKILCFLLPLAALLFASCEEVQEASKYDNWQARNEAFIDSIARETGDQLAGAQRGFHRLHRPRDGRCACSD